MTVSEQIYYLLALTRVNGVGAITARKLISAFKNVNELFRSSEDELQRTFGIGKLLAKNISQFRGFDIVDRELKFIDEEQVQILTILDDHYPPLLKHCPDAPVVLFARGQKAFFPERMISMVGTRNITSYGSHFIQKWMEDVKIYEPMIVSGYAFGVDIAAHLEAIRNNLTTIAVLGHGLQHTYPAMHKKYNKKIEENGFFLTEFWSTDNISKENFIQRNRIVAGISQATVVVESAKKGGSLITAKMANDYSRDVFALPGKISDLYSEGCNYLIKTNQAHLLTSVEDLSFFMNWALEKEIKKSIQPQLFLDLSDQEQLVYDILKERGKELLDIICMDTKIPMKQIGMILLQLEFKGIIRPMPGKYYEILN